MQRTVYVPLSAYQRDMGLVGRSTRSGSRPRRTTPATQLQVEKHLRDTLNARGMLVANTQTQIQNKQNAENQFGIVTKMLLTMSVLIAAVGGSGWRAHSRSMCWSGGARSA